MVWEATAGQIRGPKRAEVDKKGYIAEAIRALGDKVSQIKKILDIGLTDLVDVTYQWMEDH